MRGKRILILFSGGDAPGINAFLRAFVRLILNRVGGEPLGVKDGYLGLVRSCRRVFGGDLEVEDLKKELAEHRGLLGLRRHTQDVVLMDHESVSGIVSRGGMILGCARCEEFREPDTRRQVINLLGDLDVDGVVVCGGNGSFAGAECLAKESDLQILGVPATIDNDIVSSEMSLGVDTALNTITAAIGKFNDTAGAHHRIMVLEVMGRDSGYLAQTAALASGAEIVVTPERPALNEPKMQGIADRLEALMRAGSRHAIVLVAEGAALDPPTDAGPTKGLADFLSSHFSTAEQPSSAIEVRHSVLGHMQRGGPASAADCLLAARLAEVACNALTAHDKQSGVVAFVRGQLTLVPFNQLDQAAGDHVDHDYQLHKAISKPLTQK